MSLEIKTSQLEINHLMRQSFEEVLKIPCSRVKGNFFVAALHLVSECWTVLFIYCGTRRHCMQFVLMLYVNCYVMYQG